MQEGNQTKEQNEDRQLTALKKADVSAGIWKSICINRSKI
jgi:hypothetical protein